MAGASKKLLPSGLRRGWYTDWSGKRVFFTQRDSYKKVLAIAQATETQHKELRLKGVVLKPWEQAKADEVAGVIGDYLAWGHAQGGRGGRSWSPVHYRTRATHLKWWHSRLGLNVLGDLPGILPRVEQALRELQKQGRVDLIKAKARCKPKPLSGKSLQNYVESLNAFCEWAQGRGFLERNPLEGLAPFDTTPKTMRRAVTAGEVEALLNHCAEHRRLVYEVAFASGLRAGELRALTIDHLDTKQGGLKLDAAWTKGRKEGFQPLAGWLVARLASFSETGIALDLYRRFSAQFHRHGKASDLPRNPLLYVPSHPARDLDRDWKAAGLKKWGPGGKVDFHALRVAYTSFVLDAGANLKEAQSLARHVDPKLTMNIYARARNDRLAELAEAVAENLKPVLKEVAMKTGTNDQDLRAYGVHGEKCFAPNFLATQSGQSTCDRIKLVEAAGIEPSTLDSVNHQTSGKLPENLSQSSYVNANQSTSESEATSKLPETFSKSFISNFCAQSVHGNSDLIELAKLWDALPAEVRAGMLATARALTTKGDAR